MTKKKHKRLMASFLLVSLFNLKTQAQTTIISHPSENQEDTWSAYLKGFIQTDVMLDFQEMSFKDGFIAPSILNPQNNSFNSNFSIKQSQVGLGIKRTDSQGNSDLSGYVEIDFLGPNGTTAPRLRHAYIQWKKLLIGQAWSNFSDFDIFPNLIDFVGPNGAMFTRTIQIRYTTPLSKKETLSVSLEDPNAESIFLYSTASNWVKKSTIPILTAVYRYGNPRDYLKLGGILTPLHYEIRDEAFQSFGNNTIWGAAGMLSGRLYSSKLNNFRLQSSYGKGYSNYNSVLNGDKYDAVPDLENNRLEALKLFNILGIYEHWWTPKLSSVIYYSFSQFGKKDFIPKHLVQQFQNSGINLVYQPVKKLRIGAEATYGKQRNFGNQNVHAFRIQFSSSLSF